MKPLGTRKYINSSMEATDLGHSKFMLNLKHKRRTSLGFSTIQKGYAKITMADERVAGVASGDDDHQPLGPLQSSTSI